MSEDKHVIRKNFGRWSVTPKCCCCVPELLDSFETGLPDEPIPWDLSEYYEKENIATPGSYWRLTNQYMSYVPEEKGCVDETGKLVGLPESIAPTSYKYLWIFKLEIGCLTEDGTQIEWPENKKTSVFSC
jgi:hypothetical protein